MPESTHYVVNIEIQKVEKRALTSNPRDFTRDVENEVRVVTTEKDRIEGIKKAIRFLAIEGGLDVDV